jgi:hypothetical protein
MASQSLTRKDVLAFLNRDWALARRVKDQSIAQRIRTHGAASAFALHQMLLEQVWPTMRRQPSDVRGLIRYRRKLNRAAAAGR